MGPASMLNWRRASQVLFLSLLFVYGVVFFQLHRQVLRGYSDFVSFYTAGKILQRGQAHSLYDLALQNEVQREVAPNVEIRQAALPFVRPAFEAWLFWPLAYLPYSAAFIMWNAASCGCLIVSVLVLRQAIPELTRFSLVFSLLAVFTFFPVFITLLQGQDSILLLLVYAVGFRLLVRNRWFASGVVLGLGIIKFTLVLPFLIVFLFRKKAAVILGFAVTSFALLGVSAGTAGLAGIEQYPKFLLKVERLTRGVNVPQDMPNLRGLLAIASREKLPPAVNLGLLSLASVLLLGVVIWKWGPFPKNAELDLKIGFSLNLVVTILVSYHCHVFDLALLLIPLGAGLGALINNHESLSGRKFLIWSMAVAAFSPLYILLAFTLKAPALISLILLMFAVAIGMEMSQAAERRDPVAESTASR